jgi:RNA polymerase sigma-70 factor (ECF subfamily)
MANFIDDSVLLNRYKYGSNLSFQTLFLRHKKRIFNYINSKVKDADISNDILQDTFIKVFKIIKKGSYDEQGKFLPWVLRISHNLVMDHFRSLKRSKLTYEKDLYYTFSNIKSETESCDERIISDKTLSKTLSSMIDTLPYSQREIVKLRFYQNLSFKEIAEINNISINTALGRVRYSLNNLRKSMNSSSLKSELMQMV